MIARESILSHRLFRVSFAFTILFNVSYLLWLIFKQGNSAASINLDNIIQMFGYLIGGIFCLLGRRKNQFWKTEQTNTRLSVTLRWIPLLFSFGLICQAIGQVFYTYYYMINVSPFPSLADVIWLIGYIPMVLATLLLPTQRHSGIARSRIFMDALMLIVAAITFSWYFVLGPSLLQSNESLPAKLASSGYPFFDLLMVVSLILLSFRSTQPYLKPALYLFALGLCICVFADTSYTYITLHTTYVPGHLIDIFWPVGYMLLGLTIQLMNILWSKHNHEPSRSDLEQIRSQEETNWFRRQGVHLPYALIPAVLLLGVFIWFYAGNSLLAQGVYVGGALLITLILLRQVVVMREIRTLNEQLQVANSQLESLATTDPLTGLPNHRSLMGTLEIEIERSWRYKHTVSLLFLDIDHFKTLNDSYGHPVGDTVLREFADLARSVLRQSDVIGRWGGEEFVALLPETDAQKAMEAAERIRTAVETHLFSEGGLRITCSVGAATYPIMAHERDSLIALADQAMYTAKNLGRNQARLASDPAVLELQNTETKFHSREETALTGIVEALGYLVETHDHCTGQHMQRVGNLTTRIALELGLDTSEATMIGFAGRLHDIGKVAIPDAILLKPSSLTPEEWSIMHTHPARGGEIISRIPALRGIASTVRAHHERWDGMGYPDQLAGEKIPLGARIITIVDAYEAMTTDRPYQKARDPQWALAELQQCSGAQFDPQIVEAIVRVLREEASVTSLVGAR